jgi:four helix bundle protein
VRTADGGVPSKEKKMSKRTLACPEDFDFERLDVYKASELHLELASRIRTTAKVRDQLDRASESILLNIAEGSGKPAGSRDRRKFYNIALGSAKECACAWTILSTRRRVDSGLARSAREVLLRIVAMLTRMAG